MNPAGYDPDKTVQNVNQLFFSHPAGSPRSDTSALPRWPNFKSFTEEMCTRNKWLIDPEHPNPIYVRDETDAYVAVWRVIIEHPDSELRSKLETVGLKLPAKVIAKFLIEQNAEREYHTFGSILHKLGKTETQALDVGGRGWYNGALDFSNWLLRAIDIRGVDEKYQDYKFACILMELGQTDLKALFARKEPDILTRCELVRQAVLGLGEMHKKKVLHLDVKPANVIVFSENPPHAKLADFGISAQMGSRDPTGGGTRFYRSPSLARLWEWEPREKTALSLTEATDVYSAGVLLAEALGCPRPQREPPPLSDKETDLKQWQAHIEEWWNTLGSYIDAGIGKWSPLGGDPETQERLKKSPFSKHMISTITIATHPKREERFRNANVLADAIKTGLNIAAKAIANEHSPKEGS